MILQQDYNETLAGFLKLKPLKTWNISLPNLQDFQLHASEIKIEAMQPGTYIILASINPEFNTTQNIIARQTVYVSNISYLSNNKDELYILNRDNGLPLANAEVQLWQQKYNYNTQK